jgi:hypothetical protein
MGTASRAFGLNRGSLFTVSAGLFAAFTAIAPGSVWAQPQEGQVARATAPRVLRPVPATTTASAPLIEASDAIESAKIFSQVPRNVGIIVNAGSDVDRKLLENATAGIGRGLTAKGALQTQGYLNVLTEQKFLGAVTFGFAVGGKVVVIDNEDQFNAEEVRYILETVGQRAKDTCPTSTATQQAGTLGCTLGGG